MTKWTRFMDMHSGGGTKEPPYEYIYIEAPESEARSVFYARFGHSPDRVSCTCCGEDYSVSEADSLEEATAYERGCRYAYFDAAGQEVSRPDAFIPRRGWRPGYSQRYVEEPKDGETWGSPYVPLGDYLRRPDVLVIRASEISDQERRQSVPCQGYVWHD